MERVSGRSLSPDRVSASKPSMRRTLLKIMLQNIYENVPGHGTLTLSMCYVHVPQLCQRSTSIRGSQVVLYMYLLESSIDSPCNLPMGEMSCWNLATAVRHGYSINGCARHVVLRSMNVLPVDLITTSGVVQVSAVG